MDNHDRYEEDLEKLQKDVNSLYELVKNINREITNIKNRMNLRQQAENTPPVTLSDPVGPSALGKSIGKTWYERLSNKTSYPIASPEKDK